MDPLRIYDYLTLARGRLFDAARLLGGEEQTRGFPIGLGTLGRTLTHIMICEWAYVQRIQGRDVPPYEQWRIRDEAPPPLAELEAEWLEQAVRTRAALSAVADWSAIIRYRVADDGGGAIEVTATAADIFTQLALHEVHHRAQAMNILRHLGAAVDDIDFNALMFTRRPASG